ncbi:unnamed protein product [Ambrosiozyma monospora]|uniref:Unnamed protein product n=1 Tax=Ambrosiozyma monospora TaxID=43982 RepID=A0ACB5T0Z1_AMBMO|nr:unnamed protein product [Ambrosiozyma monospora]
MSSDQQHPSPQSSYGGSPGIPQNSSNGTNAYGSSSQPTNTGFPPANANNSASASAAAAAAKASFNVKTSKQILPFENEALRLKQKCKDLTQRIQDVEHNNEIRAVLVSRLRQTIKGLRFEYGILLEALERKANDGAIPGLDKLTPENLDPSDLEGLSLSEITHLLSTTPLEVAKANEKLLPKVCLDLDVSTAQTQSQNQQASISSQVSGADNANDAATTTGSKRKRGSNKVKKIKDPNLPKRPTNAYLIFCEMNKERLR